MLFIILFTVFAQVLADVKIDSLPIFASFKPLKGGLTLVDRDRARFRSLFAKHEKRAQSIRLNNTGLEYTLKVGFGSPPTYYELLVDTGSRDTWIGSRGKYVETKTSIKQNKEFSIEYAIGSVTGVVYKDLVTLSPSLRIANMLFGVASSVKDLEGNSNGILGLGPTVPGTLGPTIMDLLLAQKKIQQSVFGVSFAPTTHEGAINGELTFGGINPQKYTGKLNWVEITKKKPWNEHWSFEQTIKYGNEILQPSSVGVVDTGSALIYINSKAFDAYSKSLPGSKIDQYSGLLEIPEASVGDMKSLFFVINGVPYELTPNAQLWPRALNKMLGGEADGYYSVISTLGDFGDINFINGYPFLERFYTAYDASKSSIGFATTASTHAYVN